MEFLAVPLRSILAAVILGGRRITNTKTADAPASTLGTPTSFVPSDWLRHERPTLVKALVGVKVYRDIEYVPGASQQPLATPELMAPEAVAYIKAGGKTRAFDLFLPPELQAQMPVVVWFHGSPATGKLIQAVACHPNWDNPAWAETQEFVVDLTTYSFAAGWHATTKTAVGFWESDQDWPEGFP